MRKSLISLVLGIALNTSGCAGVCKSIKDVGYVTRPYKVSNKKDDELVEKDGKFYLRGKWREDVYQCRKGKKTGKYTINYTALEGADELIREN